jgi:eukaryotic-like serine/threonine-protein kinase
MECFSSHGNWPDPGQPRTFSPSSTVNESLDRVEQTTTGEKLQPTETADSEFTESHCGELVARYEKQSREPRLSWTTHLRLLRKLGEGGQGIVYLAERPGADNFTLPVALKFFSPERYKRPEDYDLDMVRVGNVAAMVARIQHDNLLLVQNYLDRERIRVMIMEWVEGFDLRRLLTPKMFTVMQERFSQKRWQHLNQVLVTAGPEQPRFKAGVAVAIVRNCLNALGALHRHGIVHADIKPANIMLKASGQAKIIDIGSAFQLNDPPKRRSITPAYAAVEVLQGEETTALSDLASLGYVLVELLSGQTLFSAEQDAGKLLFAKREIFQLLPDILPEEVVRNDLLMSFIQGLVAPNPVDRFQSAESAVVVEDGAAAFQRQLIKGDLASEYENDIRVWIEELLEMEIKGQL